MSRSDVFTDANVLHWGQQFGALDLTCACSWISLFINEGFWEIADKIMMLTFLVLFLGICVLDSKGKTILQIVQQFAFVYSIRKQGHSFISYSFICGAYTINILSKLLQMRTISLIKSPFNTCSSRFSRCSGWIKDITGNWSSQFDHWCPKVAYIFSGQRVSGYIGSIGNSSAWTRWSIQLFSRFI